MAAAMGFAMALSLRRQSSLRPDQQPWLWCRSSRMAHEHGGLYGHGIEIMGLSASRVITVVLGKHTTILWMVEEALKSAALSCVIADINPEKSSLTAMRRLALAAKSGQTPAILVLARASDAASPARSRWRVGSLPSLPPHPRRRAPGNPAWSLDSPAAGGENREFSLWNGIMRRIVSLWLPLFPVERLLRDGGRLGSRCRRRRPLSPGQRRG